MSKTIYFSIDQTPEGDIQLAINDDSGGYRICGPKYDGRSRIIERHKLTPRDVEEIKRYLSHVGGTSIERCLYCDEVVAPGHDCSALSRDGGLK